MSADFWAGYLSGAAGILIGNPLDLLKTRLQADAIPAAAATTSPQTLAGQFDRAGTLVKGRARCRDVIALRLRSRPCADMACSAQAPPRPF